MNIDVAAKPQHLTALERANEVRLERARLLAIVAEEPDSHSSRERAAALVLDPPPELETMRVYQLLTRVRRSGRAIARRQLLATGVSEFRTLGQLTMRQRLCLSELLRHSDRTDRMPSIAAAAGVASTLWEAGLRSEAIAAWWRRRRDELGGLTPRQALRSNASRVLDLAQADAPNLAADLEEADHAH